MLPGTWVKDGLRNVTPAIKSHTECQEQKLVAMTYLLHIGHEVVGDTHGVLPQLTARVRPHGVEVTQQQDAPGGIGDAQIPENSSQKTK